jgi:Flp pilus assembly protein TadG
LRLSDDRGAVTAETALALPSLLLVAAVVIAGIAWAGQAVRCQSAAGELARAITREESPARIADLEQRVLPVGATAQRVEDGSIVRVKVRWQPTGGGPAWVRVAPPIEVEAVAMVQS